MAEKKLTKEEKKRLKEGKKQAARRAKEAAKAEKIREKLARKEAKRAAKEAKKRGVKPADDEVKEDETEKVVKTSAAPETPAETAPETPAETAPETDEAEDEEAEEDEKTESAEKKAVNRPKNYHVSLREDGKWQVKFAKGARALKLFDTQADAIAFAREKAENQDGTITIHKKDGKIRKQRYDKQ